MTKSSRNFKELIEIARCELPDNYQKHINPPFEKFLKVTGFDRTYIRGCGAFLYDENGNEFIDCVAGHAVHSLGRSHPDIVAALQSALASEHPGWIQFECNPLSALLARRLAVRVPGDLQYVLFNNSGTEAVECALKLSRRFTGRDAVLHCEKAFHGLTLGALAANGNPNLREGFGTLGDSQSIPMNDLVALEQALQTRKFAAFIVEPVQGKTCIQVDDGYLKEATRLCKLHGTLLIVDEIQTGIGRTGKFVALEYDPGCEPDIVVLSKALSGGFVPIGAVLVRGDVWRCTFDSMARSFVHSSTFQGGTLAMVAALTVLEVYDREQLGERALQMGSIIRNGSLEIASRHPALASVRGRGLMIGLELRRGETESVISKIPGIGSFEKLLFGQSFAMDLLATHRILSQVTDSQSNVLKITPPLVICEGECNRIVSALSETFHRHSWPSAPFINGIKQVAFNFIR